jgi:hypothetical protein
MGWQVGIGRARITICGGNGGPTGAAVEPGVLAELVPATGKHGQKHVCALDERLSRPVGPGCAHPTTVGGPATTGKSDTGRLNGLCSRRQFAGAISTCRSTRSGRRNGEREMGGPVQASSKGCRRHGGLVALSCTTGGALTYTLAQPRVFSRPRGRRLRASRVRSDERWGFASLPVQSPSPRPPVRPPVFSKAFNQKQFLSTHPVCDSCRVACPEFCMGSATTLPMLKTSPHHRGRIPSTT